MTKTHLATRVAVTIVFTFLYLAFLTETGVLVQEFGAHPVGDPWDQTGPKRARAQDPKGSNRARPEPGPNKFPKQGLADEGF